VAAGVPPPVGPEHLAQRKHGVSMKSHAIPGGETHALSGKQGCLCLLSTGRDGALRRLRRVQRRNDSHKVAPTPRTVPPATARAGTSQRDVPSALGSERAQEGESPSLVELNASN
jgi:hypothetical protein